MNGELLPVWDRAWQEIWIRLSRSSKTPRDIFVELAGGLAKAPVEPSPPDQPTPGSFDADGVLIDPVAIKARADYESALEQYSKTRSEYVTALTSPHLAKQLFHATLDGVSTEQEAIDFLESAIEVVVSFGDSNLTSRLRKIVREFISKFNLRYDLRPDFSLQTTIPGVFAKLIAELKGLAAQDPHIDELLSEFEGAFGDLRIDQTQTRMKTSLHKQFNLLEAFAQKYPGVSESTLGAICNHLDWPHATIKEVGKKLYGFRCDYPGLAHAGSPRSALRQLEMKDFISISLMLAALTPYLAHGLASDRCYKA